jgi:SAM-dependent methyltransferase
MRHAQGERKETRGFRDLQRGLTGERSLIGGAYMDDPKLLRAYLDFYWPISFEQARRALAVSGFLLGRPLGARAVIDVGSGPGPVAAAFAASGATALTLLDQSPRALELARETIPARAMIPARSSPRVGEAPRGGASPLSIATVAMDIAEPDPSRIPLWGAADCVSFGHSLNEVAFDRPDRVSIRARLLERYAAALAPGGSILAVEPALLSTSRDLIAVRNLLVSRGWKVLAPCVGREALECPALAAGEGQTCHDAVRWDMPRSVESLARELKLDKESLKMTWFLLEPPSELTLNGASRAAGVHDDANGVLDDADGTHGDADERLFRVVSDPMLNKGGRVRRLLCGSAGRFPLSAPAGSADAARSGFDALERGDFVRVESPEPRENGWGVGAKTAVHAELGGSAR